MCDLSWSGEKIAEFARELEHECSPATFAEACRLYLRQPDKYPRNELADLLVHIRAIQEELRVSRPPLKMLPPTPLTVAEQAEIDQRIAALAHKIDMAYAEIKRTEPEQKPVTPAPCPAGAHSFTVPQGDTKACVKCGWTMVGLGIQA